jgi:hypothetical protein
MNWAAQGGKKMGRPGKERKNGKKREEREWTGWENGPEKSELCGKRKGERAGPAEAKRPKRVLKFFKISFVFSRLNQIRIRIEIQTSSTRILILSTQQYKIKCRHHEMQQANIYKA